MLLHAQLQRFLLLLPLKLVLLQGARARILRAPRRPDQHGARNSYQVFPHERVTPGRDGILPV